MFSQLLNVPARCSEGFNRLISKRLGTSYYWTATEKQLAKIRIASTISLKANLNANLATARNKPW